MVKDIYLDNSATTRLGPEAKSAMQEVMETFGNPSSLHALGIEAEKVVSTARRQVAEALGLKKYNPENIVFTSCGSEANGLALLGSAHAKERMPHRRIITTDSEHPSVENHLQQLEKEGFEVVRVSTRGGCLSWEEIDRVLDGTVFLVTMMMVNNETGAHYDVGRVFSMAKKRNPEVITHCDAVQGFLKIPFSPDSIHADLVTISAHKIHGPKGAGALYISPRIIKEKRIVPVLRGGGQESGFRSGTENTIGRAGFGAAAKAAYSRLAGNIAQMEKVRQYAMEKLQKTEIVCNLPGEQAAPHILNITLPSVKSETMLHYLSSRHIYVSSGSACSARSGKVSSVLLAYGKTAREADCSLRISLCEDNTEEEIDALADALRDGLDSLIRIR